MFKKSLWVGIFCQILFSGVAFADSPQFPFESADAAFATAALPTTAQVSGSWYLIGIAENPDLTTDLLGYWANGIFQLPGYSGYFYQRADVILGTDAFGNSSITWDEQRIGNETGDLYGDYLSTGAFSATGLVTTLQATDTDCASSNECRMVAAESMLLCRMTVTDTRFSCRQDSADNTQITYMAYKQFATVP